jgi:hypothetical protein
VLGDDTADLLRLVWRQAHMIGDRDLAHCATPRDASLKYSWLLGVCRTPTSAAKHHPGPCLVRRSSLAARFAAHQPSSQGERLLPKGGAPAQHPDQRRGPRLSLPARTLSAASACSAARSSTTFSETVDCPSAALLGPAGSRRSRRRRIPARMHPIPTDAR